MLISRSSYYALITVVELSLLNNKNGMSLSDISKQHNIPERILIPIAEQLRTAGFLTIAQGQDQGHWLILKKGTENLSAFDIVQLFDHEMFSPIEQESDQWMCTNNTARLIRQEQKHYISYLQNRLKKISIRWWCDRLEKRHHLFSHLSYNKEWHVIHKSHTALTSTNGSLIGSWMISEEYPIENGVLTSVETLEFKENGTGSWSQADDSGLFEGWMENFSYQVVENSIIFFTSDGEQSKQIRFQVNKNKLILFYECPINKIIYKESPISILIEKYKTIS